jgi:hypothetical protein
VKLAEAPFTKTAVAGNGPLKAPGCAEPTFTNPYGTTPFAVASPLFETVTTKVKAWFKETDAGESTAEATCSCGTVWITTAAEGVTTVAVPVVACATAVKFANPLPVNWYRKVKFVLPFAGTFPTKAGTGPLMYCPGAVVRLPKP